MSKEGNIHTKTAERLGVQDPTTVKKCEEFLRSLQSKGSLKNINDVAKTVLCLDLAAKFLGNSFDRESGIKLSGLKKSAYQSNLHMIEILLSLDKTLTVSELCVQFGCTVIKELAEEIFEKYKTSDNKIKDLNHPQYAVVAVHTACKLKNIKLVKSKCIDISRLKPSQWKELVLEFEKFTSSFGIGSPKKRRKAADLQNIVDDLADEIENKVTIKRSNQEEEEVEDYDIWRKRILDDAYQKLKMQPQNPSS